MNGAGSDSEKKRDRTTLGPEEREKTLNKKTKKYHFGIPATLFALNFISTRS